MQKGRNTFWWWHWVIAIRQFIKQAPSYILLQHIKKNECIKNIKQNDASQLLLIVSDCWMMTKGYKNCFQSYNLKSSFGRFSRAIMMISCSATSPSRVYAVLMSQLLQGYREEDKKEKLPLDLWMSIWQKRIWKIYLNWQWLIFVITP